MSSLRPDFYYFTSFQTYVMQLILQTCINDTFLNVLQRPPTSTHLLPHPNYVHFAFKSDKYLSYVYKNVNVLKFFNRRNNSLLIPSDNDIYLIVAWLIIQIAIKCPVFVSLDKASTIDTIHSVMYFYVAGRSCLFAMLLSSNITISVDKNYVKSLWFRTKNKSK